MTSFAQRARRKVGVAMTTKSLSATSKQVRDERLTYLSPTRLATLEKSMARINRQGIRGDVIECGVALGGSTVVLAKHMGTARHLHAYDVFGMIPAPTDDDPPAVHERYRIIRDGTSTGIGGDDYYGYMNDLEGHVTRTLERYGHPVGERVTLHKGLFNDTLRLTGPVALAHIDCDWHDPVDCCLRRIGEWLSPGGLMILDDYDDYGGAQTATDKYVAEMPSMSLVRFTTNVAVVANL